VPHQGLEEAITRHRLGEEIVHPRLAAAVGAKVTAFEVGDEVVSSPGHRGMGRDADEVVTRADECAVKPRRA
jgi:hypothetical protein